MSDKWIVNTKGGAGEEFFEISVVRESNEHGIESYGWIDKDKLLITHNGGHCRWPITQFVWDGCIQLAQQLADNLNGAGGEG